MSGSGKLSFDFYPPLVGKYSLSVIGLQAGVLGYYWDNIWFDGSYEVKTHKNLNLTWTGRIMTSFANEFVSAKFFTFLVPKFSENYTISVLADDNVRVYVNGNLFIDFWTTCCEEISDVIYLEKEKYYYLKVEYRQMYSEAVLVMFWSSPSQSKQVIPEESFWMPQRIQSPWVQKVTQGKSRWDLCYVSFEAKVKAGYQNTMSFYSVDYNGKVTDNPSDVFTIFFSDDYQLASSYVANGVSSLNFTLKTKGLQSFTVKLYDYPIKGSPFVLEVLPGDISPTLTSTDLDMQGSFVVGQFMNFTIFPFDSFNNVVDDLEGLSVKIYLIEPILSELQISQPSGWLEKFNKTIIRRAFPLISFKCFIAGTYEVFLSVSDRVVQGYPKQIFVNHSSFMAENSAVHYESTSVIAGEKFSAFIQARDNFFNNMTSNISLESFSFTSLNGNTGTVSVMSGIIQVEIALTIAGSNSLTLVIDSVPIPMPKVNVEANAILSYSYSILQVGQSSYKSGASVLATIISKDNYGNSRYNPDDSYAVTVETADFDIQDNHDGSYSIIFIPLKTGSYKISVFANSLHIKGSPVTISVATSNVRGFFSELVVKDLKAGSGYLNITSKDIGGNSVLNPVRNPLMGFQYYVGFFAGPVKLSRNATFLDYSNFIINCSLLTKSGRYSVVLALFEENGLLGFYYKDNFFQDLVGSRDFNNHQGEGPQVYSEKSKNINFDWGPSNPHIDLEVLPDLFSVKWVGMIRPSFTESYTFKLVTDCRVMLRIAGKTLFDTISTQKIISTLSDSLQLTSNTFYDFVLNYQNCGSQGKLLLYWSSVSESLKIIPANAFFAQINSNGSPYQLLISPSSTSASNSVLSSGAEGIYRAQAGVQKIFKLIANDKFGNQQTGNDLFFAIFSSELEKNFEGSAGEYYLTVTFNVRRTEEVRVFFKNQFGAVESVKKFNVDVHPGPALASNTQISELHEPTAGTWDQFLIVLYDKFSNPLNVGGDNVEVRICFMTSRNVTKDSNESPSNDTNADSNFTIENICESIPNSQITVKDLNDGRYKASFLVFNSTLHNIEVLVNSISALNESLEVFPGEVSPEQCQLSLPSTLSIDQNLSISVTLKDKYLNNINSYQKVVSYIYMSDNQNFKPAKLILNPISEFSYNQDFLLTLENFNSSCSAPDSGCSFNGTLKVAAWVLSKGLIGRYFDNLELSGTAKATRVDETMDLVFGSSILGIPNGKFGVVWEGLIFPGGLELPLLISGDDSASVFIDGEEVLNLHGQTQYLLPAEVYFFTEVRYNNSDSSGFFKLSDSQTGSALTGDTLAHFKDGTFVSGSEGIVLVN